MTTSHPFDKALALTRSDLHAGQYTGTTSPDYWNMVGPFGGTTAALALKAVLQHPELLGTPVALTVNYAAAIEAGAFEIEATPVRTNRSTQHWTIHIAQPGSDGTPQVNTTATAITALRRDTWGACDQPMPEVQAPTHFQAYDAAASPIAWFRQYEMRPVSGAIPGTWDGGGTHSESRLWMRDVPARPLDFTSLASMSDMFFPRVWLRRATRVPAGTVSLTTYFHAGASQLAAVGTGYLHGRAVGQQFHNGYFDQVAHLWSEAGNLLATSNQIVYYKQ